VSVCSVEVKSWSELSIDELYAIVRIRCEVFYVEQRIDEQEFDDRDREPATRHYWIADEAGVAAYLRTIVDPEPGYRDARHSFGRVVVRGDRRGEGLAQKLIHAVLERHEGGALFLHAQEYIAPLYRKYGFESAGEPYVEAGLPHVMMYRPATT
jgi:ElaA protein